jgi:Protein of unknown function (DUF3039)
MTTQTTTRVDEQSVIDALDLDSLDSLDTSMDKIFVHRTPYQQGATSITEMLALSKVTALCGFKFNPTKSYVVNIPPICPRCEHIWRTRS